jgi:glycosyltransferase involved in cell wall biosynthesis
MIRGRNIICFSPYDWRWKTYGSCKRWMNIFSKENRVLYINNIQFLKPKIGEIGVGTFQKRLMRKLESLVKPFFKPEKTIFVYTPILFPHYGSAIKKKLNELSLRLQMQFLQYALGFQNPILWVENPVGVTVARQLHPALIIYYQIDKYENHSELRNPKEIIQLDHRLTRESDIVLCASLKLYEEKLGFRNKEVYYMPHGVDFEHFYEATKPLPIPEEMKHIPHPIVGYFGSLDAKNDDSIIRYCATHRPDISFVLIGEKGGRNNSLEGLPNVQFLGYKEYSQLPYYGKAFDACIMFWKQSEWIEYCNPVKTMEYLAMGKPVISVPFHEISKRYDEIIATARSPEEFLRKIEEEIAHDSLQRKQVRINFVRNETWEAKAEYVSRLVEEKIDQKQRMGVDQNQR